MTVKELRKILFTMDDNAEIIIGCQGYLSEYNADEKLNVTETGNAVYITDSCFYPEVFGAR